MNAEGPSIFDFGIRIDSINELDSYLIKNRIHSLHLAKKSG